MLVISVLFSCSADQIPDPIVHCPAPKTPSEDLSTSLDAVGGGIGEDGPWLPATSHLIGSDELETHALWQPGLGELAVTTSRGECVSISLYGSSRLELQLVGWDEPVSAIGCGSVRPVTSGDNRLNLLWNGTQERTCTLLIVGNAFEGGMQVAILDDLTLHSGRQVHHVASPTLVLRGEIEARLRQQMATADPLGEAMPIWFAELEGEASWDTGLVPPELRLSSR